ncbi:Biopolymer transport protein ExbD/TolR [Parapedobacter composti]|uniref:Biopolymer transport protein ExbD/TolR n=1 Tax=Parapedobacter composti TaxID=623281 RepID=A0A1I1K8W8_9SPHI|nr:biopolymer transporter ExbD [Parapedobacter composti]SFC57314.1 Biopolymer transport protein ExbD/TolR [Parapedobacter composti]
MAELNQDSGGGKKGGGKVRSKKQGGRVDLTAMVDLAFLLITFFMLTTSLNKPNAMDVAMPDKNEEDPEDRLEVADNRTLTLLLGSNNKIEWYLGQYSEPIEGPEIADYGKDGIRPILLKKMQEVQQKTGQGLIIVIRPSEKATHRNLVDILDEMNIVEAKQYMIGTISEPEIEALKRDGLYND